jgi:predicted site-specific integrase-resolvase
MAVPLKKPREDWLDVDEAARYLGVSRTTLFRLRHAGKVKAANDNPLLERPRTLYFEKDALDMLRKEAEKNKAKE